jgi:hypothetical protein
LDIYTRGHLERKVVQESLGIRVSVKPTVRNEHVVSEQQLDGSQKYTQGVPQYAHDL